MELTQGKISEIISNYGLYDKSVLKILVTY